jgi:hypothetical protein
MLQRNLDAILHHYGSYVDFIHKSILAQGITVNTLREYLLSLSAFSAGRHVELLSDVKPELEEATTIGEIFNLLASKCTSFFNYNIFEFLATEYNISEDVEELKYSMHLDKYIKKHSIAEFITLNPALKVIESKSKKLMLKFDIALTCRLAKITDLRSHVAKVLNMNEAAVQLIDIEEGCLLLTFLIPSKVADILLASDTSFSQNDIEQFRSCSVLWLEVDGDRDFHVNVQDNIRGNSSYMCMCDL